MNLRHRFGERRRPAYSPISAFHPKPLGPFVTQNVHILKGEYPVAKGLTVGHEPVGVIEKLGSAVTGYEEGQRVITGAITPSGHSCASFCGCHSQDGPDTPHGFKPTPSS